MRKLRPLPQVWGSIVRVPKSYTFETKTFQGADVESERAPVLTHRE